VFSADGRNFLLAFPRKIRNKVFDRLQTVGTALTDSAHESVSGQKQSAKVEAGTGLISSLMGEKSVTQRWERGEISNFEYLMCLNTLAGRSYNDLMQYPVFPWIIADYDSQELDLNDISTFRDLSRPMGAQTPERLKQFEKRYNDWDDPTGETPPYHYGTHYSSAMIVASYLVRMEPFTQTFLHLQGGHFDLADRMFHSVKDAWLSAAKHNMADVKELIPEFFYLPEFLLNSNNFDLGTKQSGVPLGDVVLPAWAKGDSREFIRAHREALECDLVSSRLNEWIDLIFGYKQQYPAAVEAVNVFHHLFYEGNVDIYAIDDPLKRTATIGFINNFGQIPKQLFKKPHPQKKLAIRGFPSTVSQVGLPPDRLFFHNVDNLKPTMQPVKELKGAVGQIIHTERHTVLAVEQNKALIPPGYSRFIAWGFPDMSIRIGTYDSDKASTVYENTDSGDILCAVCPNCKLFISAGTNTVVNVWEFGKGRDRHRLVLKQSLFGHSEAVTCLAASSAYNIIVSGSRDRTCIIWDLNELVFVRQLRGHAAPVAAVCINELTGDIATCAGTYLHLWSINGSEIANINTAVGRNQQILCVAMSQMREWDVSNVIMTGNSDGVVRMWSLEFVEVADEDVKVKTNSFQVPDADSVSVTSSLVTDSSQPVDIPQTARRRHLEEFKDLSTRCQQLTECGSSVDSDTGHMVGAVQQWLSAERDTDSQPVSDSKLRLIMTSTDDSGSVDTAVTLLSRDQQSPVARWTKSPLDIAVDSPESGDFCIVTDLDVKDAVSSLPAGTLSTAHRRKLRDGFHWQKQLVFRSKLTMHTAFERKDNKDPAAVTALAVSRDHKSLYVGDAKGRVYTWSVTDQPGRSVVDHWVKDEGGDCCVSCSVRFSFAERRHHCRNCGQLFCSKCSSYETEIRRLRILKPVRVCQSCYKIVQVQNGSAAETKDKTSRINPVV
jgi:WD40 repeat protein